MFRLIVTEKPSVAQAIAAALDIQDKKAGYLEGSGYLVSWCVGHLVELAPPEQYDPRYARWHLEDLPIVPQAWAYGVIQKTARQFQVLQRLMLRPDVEAVICATDAGREGELIFRLAYAQAGCAKSVERLWISSLEASAIREGFQRLKPAAQYDALYQAALCRAQADWLVGINATRLFSLRCGAVMQVGRVMSPTLALLVQREEEIAAFHPQPFYTVELDCGFTAQSQRFSHRQQAEAVQRACQGQSAAVCGIETTRRVVQPPKLYDLTSLQRDANRVYGYTAQQTLDYAQSLYEKKLLTYPRTDSRYLPQDMAAGLSALAADMQAAMPFTDGLHLLFHAGQAVDDAQVTDHHALLPTGAAARADLAALPRSELDLLHLVCLRLLCALSEPCVICDTTVTLACAGTQFTAKGQQVLEMGWTVPCETFRGHLQARGIAGPAKRPPELPELREGQQLAVTAAVHAGQTAPPSRYTDASLLRAMETAGAQEAGARHKGLGTPATRAGTLEKLVQCGYVERQGKGRSMVLLPTAKGKQIISLLPETLRSPEMTARWEERLGQMEQGAYTPEDFLAGIRGMLRELMGTAPGKQTHFKETPPVGRCPWCGGEVAEMQRGFFCGNQNCKFAIWKDNPWWAAKRKQPTHALVAALLRDGRTRLTGCYSAKTGKVYDATVMLDTSEKEQVRFLLTFDKPGKEQKCV